MLAQCVDGSWAACVGGSGLNVPFEELCTEVQVLRWTGSAWDYDIIAALPEP
jgi:hypothetical protein